MNTEKIIVYLEMNNLLEELSKKMYYINYVNYRSVLGKSSHVDWLERVELHYNTKYYINGKEFFTEDMISLYDEWDYIGTRSVSPVECFKQKPLSKTGLIELIKKLSKEKMEFLLRTLSMDEFEIRRLLNEEDIKRQNDISILQKSITDMQVALYSIISVLGTKITIDDMENTKKILQKANDHINSLKQEENKQEEPVKLELK